MWKRLLVVIIALVGTFSVVYVSNSEMFAASTTYNAGGAVTGRINKAPSNLKLKSGAKNIGIQKGDKLLIGLRNPKDGSDLGWQLIHYDSNYNITGVSCTNAAGSPILCSMTKQGANYEFTTSTTQSAWYSMSSESIGAVSAVDQVPNWKDEASITSLGWRYFADAPIINSEYYIVMCDFEHGNLKGIFDTLNNGISGNTAKVIANRDLKTLAQANSSSCVAGADINCEYAKATANTAALYNGKKAYLENAPTISGKWPFYALLDQPTNAFNLNPIDVAFPVEYASDFMYYAAGSGPQASHVLTGMKMKLNGEVEPYEAVPSQQINVRPSIMVDTKDLVFAVSKGTGTTWASVTAPKIPSSYSSLHDATTGYKNMKMRIDDKTLTVALTDVVNDAGTSISYIGKDSKVYIKAQASNDRGTTVSALLFDENGNFKYYKPLGVAQGNTDKLYELDMTDVAIGSYQIAIVNEEYNDATTAPANSSLLSAVKSIHVTTKSTATLELDKASVVQDMTANGANYTTTIMTTNSDLRLSSTVRPTYTFSSNNNTALSVTSDNVVSQISSSNPTKYGISFTVKPNVSYTGTDLPKTVVLTIGLGKTNLFNAATSITKSFYVYKELNSLNFTAKQFGGNYNTTQVNAGSEVGTLTFKDGVSDFTVDMSANGDTGYNATQAAQNGSFQVVKSGTGSTTKYTVKTKVALAAGTYNAQFKVKDAKGKLLMTNTVIKVAKQAQAPLEFKDKNGGTKITSLSAEYSAKTGANVTTQLFAEGGTGNGAVTYSLKSGADTSVFSVNSADGKITTLKSGGPVSIIATKAATADYDAITSEEFPVTITAGGQSVTFPTEVIKNAILSDTSFTIEATVTRNDGSTAMPTYTSKTMDVCTVDSTGNVTMNIAGKCTIDASNSDENYQPETTSIDVEILDGMNSTFELIVNPLTFGTTVNTAIGKMKDTTGGDGTYHYRLKNDSTLLTISEDDGIIKLSRSLELGDIASKWDESEGKYIIRETIVIKDGSGYEIEKEVAIICEGKQLQASFDGATDGIIHVPFTGVGGSFALTIKDNLGNGGIVYSIVEDASDVIDSITQAGLLIQKNASENDTDYATVKAVIAPKGGYAGQEITVKIVIDKATQTVAFAAATPSQVSFVDQKTFSVLATSTPTGASITYEASPNTVCTISGNTVSMVGQGVCQIKATASKANFNNAEVTKDILFYQDLNGDFVLTHNSLEAKGNNDPSVGTDAIPVGHMNISGGASDTTTYSMSTNVGDKNAASSLFSVTQNDGDVSLNHELKAEDLEQFATYDAIHDVYLLKVQIDVINGSDTKTKDCEIKIKGAPLKNLSFMGATNNIITKVYTKNDVDKIFDLGMSGNEGNGPIAFRLKSGSDLSSTSIVLSGTNNKKVTIAHADDKYAIVVADITQSKGYAKTQAEVKIKIDKADQVNFALTSEQQNLKLLLDEKVTITPPVNDSEETVEITSDKADVVEVLADGETLRALKAGTATISLKSLGNRNYNEKILTINVNVFGSLSGEIKQKDEQILQAENTATINQAVGSFKIKGGLSAIDDITATLAENPNIKLSNDGSGNYTLRLKKTISATDIASYTYDSISDVYLVPINIELFDPLLSIDEQKVTITDNIKIKGADMESDIDFTDAQNGMISKVYSLGDEIALSLVEKTYIDPTTVIYRRKSDLANGVISIGREGNNYIAYVEGASQEGDPKVFIEAVIPAQKGYKGKIIETEVKIAKAEQEFDFDSLTTKIKVGDSKPVTFTSVPKGNNGIVILESDTNKVTITNGRAPSITAVTEGENIKITATAKGNENYNDKVVERYIEVYNSVSLLFEQTSPYPQANSESSEANDPAGTFSSEHGAGNVLIELEDVANFADNTYFQITNTGALSFNTDITADILSNYTWNETEKAYEMQVKFKLTDESSEVTYATETVYVKGASLSNISFKDKEGNATDTITRNYADKQFMLELTGKVGNTWPYGDVTYSLEVENSSASDGSSTIIESIDAVTGIAKILNANLAGSNEVANAKASIKAAHGYDEQEVKAKLIIEKANQPDFKFGSTLYPLELNGGEFHVVLLDKLSSGPVTYDIVDESKVSYDAETDIFTPLALGSTLVTATTDMNDRNYNVAQAQTTIQVNAGAPDFLMIQIDQGSTVTYGDTGTTASIKSSTITGTVTSQTWSSSDSEVATIDETTGAITILGRGQTYITLTQEIEGRTESVTSVSVMLNVKRKVLYVKIADAQKLVGEDMPNFAIEQVTGLVGTDTFIFPVSFVCLDGDDNHVNSYTGVGEYEIKGSFNENDNPNYTLKVDNGATSTVTNGILSVRQDGSDPSWYTVRSNASPTEAGWYNKDVFLDLNLVEGQEYDKISDKINGAYDVSIPVQEDGIHDKDIYFKASRNNAIATPQEATLKVDQTSPNITSIAGKTINDSTFARVMNALTLNVFFKPGSEITINAKDVAPQVGIETSGIAKIEYEVHSVTADEEGNTLIKEGSETSDQASFRIDDLGEYNICTSATDYAGNVSSQTCQKATISKIDVDVDGDDKPDFNDTNDDGCPDLNIKWKDPKDPNKWIIINGDRNYDGVPDLNVDSDGDGKANLNIDTDGDYLPDINLVILKQGDWTAGTCLVGEVEEYSGGTTPVTPQINIDTGDDQIPDINIDTTGDMKPDYNITKPNETKPYMNIGPIHAQWLPKKDCNITNFAYDTDDSFKPLLNIDSDHDGLPDINVDFDDDGNPDINIDLDFDNIPDVDIDGDGDGKADINLDPDKTGSPTRNITDIKEWKPNHNVEGDVPYDTMIIKLKDTLEDNDIVIEKPNGDKFPPYYSLKVRNITKQISESERVIMEAFLSTDTEVKEIFDVKLYANGIQIDPDETIRVRLPLSESYRASKTLKLIVEQKDSTFVETPFERAEDHITYETNFLGDVGIIADINKSTPIQPDEESLNKDSSNNDREKDSNSAFGGSFTGDTTNASNSFLIGISALMVLCYQLHRRKNIK